LYSNSFSDPVNELTAIENQPDLIVAGLGGWNLFSGKSKGKGKVVPVCAMKTYWCRKGITQLILNLGTR